MKLVHELDVPDYETMDERDPMCPALWRYRKKITIEHLSSKFQEYSQGCDQQNKCEVLAEFLKKVLWKYCRIQRIFFWQRLHHFCCRVNVNSELLLTDFEIFFVSSLL